MKTLTLFIALILPGWLAAQVLTYNQTLWIKSASGTVTCPAGKVWKVERVVFSSTLPDVHCTASTGCSGISPHNDQIEVDGAPIPVRSMRSRGTTSGGAGMLVMLWQHEFPFWLTAGSTLATGAGVLGISVIEFTEAP
jgi:hypothetical protein